MTHSIPLDGDWKLTYYDACDGASVTPETLKTAAYPTIPAKVPGNVELDLSRAGILPADLFRGMATAESAKIESWDFWYETRFAGPELAPGETAFLVFDGVDCIADYYCNGVPVSHSENAFIPHEIDLTDTLLEGEENLLQVHLFSSVLYEARQRASEYLITGMHPAGGAYIRKPAHSFGWDIFPRAVSAGLWKSVRLELRDAYDFEEAGYHPLFHQDLSATVLFYFSVKAPLRELMEQTLTVEVSGHCGDSSFSARYPLRHIRSGQVVCEFPHPKLWWPAGYGEPNLYETKFRLLKGEQVTAEKTLYVGLRKLELQRTESLKETPSYFRFVVNNVPIQCRGSNWVPLDAYHSRDRERYAKALSLVTDAGCNILRVWGGGVYEQDCFYDFCDRHGILVWQDFMMACQTYPLNEAMRRNMEEEFTWVIRHLRHHAALALWAGDNEVDENLAGIGLDPGANRVTREWLPRLLQQHDSLRPYLPSSPYLNSRDFEDYRAGQDVFVERHLWGARDYYKASFYAQSRAHFVSETGYHGCPSPASVRKIVDAPCVWPWNNEQWTLHSSDQNGSDARVRLMADQISQLFAFQPDTLEDFSLASQISQAEAKKYFIERIRIGWPDKSGVIWWNLLDGWPQMSDAVVDYFYDKKLAYSYIRRSQTPFVLMIDEMRDWHFTLVANNATRTPKSGSYAVSDLESGDVLAQGAFQTDANANAVLCPLRMLYSDHKMLLIRWELDGETHYNHYLCGMPPFDFAWYTRMLQKLTAICGA